MKKEYYIPTIEVLMFETERLMDFADGSVKAHAPERMTPDLHTRKEEEFY